MDELQHKTMPVPPSYSISCSGMSDVPLCSRNTYHEEYYERAGEHHGFHVRFPTEVDDESQPADGHDDDHRTREEPDDGESLKSFHHQRGKTIRTDHRVVQRGFG